MRLVGMLDSPYVRRAAISMEYLGVSFTHEAVSVLMDSSLIIQFVEATVASGKTLWSRDPQILLSELRAVSLALAACDKAVQIIYERNLRPQEAQYEPWMERVSGQLLAACRGLEHDVSQLPQVFVLAPNQASITVAVAWRFMQSMLAAVVPASAHPSLVALSAKMEQASEFIKYPPAGPGVVVRENK